MSERLILMGVIGKAHGVRGLVRVNAYTEDADALADYPLQDARGRHFRLEWRHDTVAQLSEITPAGPRPLRSRDEAEALTNTQLFCPRSALPETGEEEFYLADLVGLAAVGAADETFGAVVAVHDYGGGSSLELSSGGFVPFTRAAVPVVDLANGRVVVVPPAETEGGEP